MCCMRRYKSERRTISLYRLPSDTERRQLWLCTSLTRRCNQAPRVCAVSTFAEVMQPVLEPNLALGKWSASPKKRWTPFCKCTCRMNQLCLTLMKLQLSSAGSLRGIKSLLSRSSGCHSFPSLVSFTGNVAGRASSPVLLIQGNERVIWVDGSPPRHAAELKLVQEDNFLRKKKKK